MIFSSSRSIRLFALGFLTVCSCAVFAKAPLAKKLGAQKRTGALTPPPKEWAMFPQDEPLAPPPQQLAPGHAPVQGGAVPAGQTPQYAVDNSGAVISVPVAPVHHSRPLPLGWLAMTAFLSFGALLLCGTLILRPSAADDIPVVSEALEVAA